MRNCCYGIEKSAHKWGLKGGSWNADVIRTFNMICTTLNLCFFPLCIRIIHKAGNTFSFTGNLLLVHTYTQYYMHNSVFVTNSSGGSINTFSLHSFMIKWDVQGQMPDILPNLRMSSWRSAMSSCVQASASGAITCRSKHLQTRSARESEKIMTWLEICLRDCRQQNSPECRDYDIDIPTWMQ